MRHQQRACPSEKSGQRWTGYAAAAHLGHLPFPLLLFDRSKIAHLRLIGGGPLPSFTFPKRTSLKEFSFETNVVGSCLRGFSILARIAPAE